MLTIGMYIYPEDMCGKVARASERASVGTSTGNRTTPAQGGMGFSTPAQGGHTILTCATVNLFRYTRMQCHFILNVKRPGLQTFLKLMNSTYHPSAGWSVTRTTLRWGGAPCAGVVSSKHRSGMSLFLRAKGRVCIH
jgi:hypothetical protein